MRHERSPEEVQQIKQSILDNALTLLVTEGFQAFSMRKLGKRTGMTAANLYNYFKNKDEIYLTLMAEGFEKLKKQMLQDLPTASPLESAQQLAISYLDFAFENPHYYHLMFTASAPKFGDKQLSDQLALSNREYQLSMEVVRMADAALLGLLEDAKYTSAESERKKIILEFWALLHGLVGLEASGNSPFLCSQPQEVSRDIARHYIKTKLSLLGQ